MNTVQQEDASCKLLVDDSMACRVNTDSNSVAESLSKESSCTGRNIFMFLKAQKVINFLTWSVVAVTKF